MDDRKVVKMPGAGPPELDKEGAKAMVLQLWQVTQTAPQAAQVHVACQNAKDQLVAYIDKE